MTDPDAILQIRELIAAQPDITSLLASFLGSPAIFTRRPVPGAAPYPLITISPNQMQSNEDGVADQRPILLYEIAAHGLNENPPTQYRAVTTVADKLRLLFHRRRNITIPDWAVIDQRCDGPVDAQGVSDQVTARAVRLQVRLAMQS